MTSLGGVSEKFIIWGEMILLVQHNKYPGCFRVEYKMRLLKQRNDGEIDE